MTTGPDLGVLWESRAEEISQDFARLEGLSKADEVQARPGVSARFKFLVSPLVGELKELRQQAQVEKYTAAAWDRLAVFRGRCTDMLEDYLELLGGAAVADAKLDGGFIETAKRWLDGLCEGAGLDPVNLVIGRGVGYDPKTNVAHLPFLDWDLWHLPLLARVVGLCAVAPRSPYRADLDPLIQEFLAPVQQAFETGSDGLPGPVEGWLPEVRDLLQKGFRQARSEAERENYRKRNQEKLDHLLGRQRLYFDHLFADMLVTALLGPAYPWALLALELDFRTPRRFEPEAPVEGSCQPTGERPLPPPDHRFATCLATLEAMSAAEKQTEFGRGPYDEEVRKLLDIWQVLTKAVAGTAYPIEPLIEAGGDWHRALYGRIQKRCAQTLPHTAETWRLGERWRPALCGGGVAPAAAREKNQAITAVMSAMWSCRLTYPGRSEDIAKEAARALEGEGVRRCRSDEKCSVDKAVFRIRLDRVDERIRRMGELFRKTDVLGGDGGSAITGRFLRHLSPLSCAAERCRRRLESPLRSSAWSPLTEVEAALDPLESEALAVLGGLLVRRAQLDREHRGDGLGPGPAIGDLADRILRDYVGRTGVNWDGRVVFGRDPFLESMTDVIRLRFPDWSLWSLPLLGHEFGHMVALATPNFTKYKERQAEQWTYTGTDASLRSRHLDECFADVFATYTCGPAFACTVILLHLSPAEAYLPRGAHPNHVERAQVVLEVLGCMNNATRAGRFGGGAYDDVLEILKGSWARALQGSGTVQGPASDERTLDEPRSWARQLFRDVDRLHRLGARYAPERWRIAKELAESLAKAVNPRKRNRGPLEDCMDLLNALWWLRLKLKPEAKYLNDISITALRAARPFLEV